MRHGDPRNGPRYRALRASMRGTQPCVYCERGIDDALTWPDPWSRVVAHDDAVLDGRGGDALDPSNCWPAHKVCNEKAGTRPITAPDQPLNRRPW